MKIFYNPKDRKGLEENEQKASVPTLKITEYERVESEPTRSTSASKKQAKAQSKTTTKEGEGETKES